MLNRLIFAKIFQLLIFLTCFLPVLLLPAASSGQDKKDVLILHSYHKGLEWTDSEDNGILSVLKTRASSVAAHTEYLDAKRISDDEHYRRFFELLKYKYSSVAFKVVIVSDDDAYNFYLKYHEALFPGVPAVFCGVNYFKDSQRVGQEDLITGIVEAFDIPDTLRTALRLHQNTSRVIVINDRTTTGLANKKILEEEVIPEFKKKVSFVFLEDLDMAEVLEKVKSLSQRDIILLMTFNRDRSGNVFDYNESIGLISGEARVPIYGVWEFYLGKGIVGGMLTSGGDQGRMAAEMALRIIDGERVRNIPVVKESPNRYMFDYRQMVRFDIKPSDLPGGSLIINEPPSFYAVNKGLVWGIFAGFAGLSMIILLLLANIRQRREGEKALRESEAKYRTLVDNLKIGIYRSTVDRGRFIQANPAMAKMFGYNSADDLMKIEATDLYKNPEDRASLIEEIQCNGFVKDKELAMKKRDGTPIWCADTVTAQYDENGSIKWMDGVIEDITERKKLEEQLRQAQKMEAIGTLAGGVAHDFNNILTAIIGYGNLLKLQCKGADTTRNYVDEILASADRAANLTMSLLAFSRKQTINPRPLDLNDIVRKIDKLLLRLIGEDIQFRTILADEDLTILADNSQIEQVLMNLAANSRDAMPDGGILTIRTERVDIRGEVAGSYLSPGAYAVLVVSDTGKGMDEVTRQRIFEPFFTTKAMGKGTGLGLSMVYGIIKQHNGDIYVYSEPGKGTTFKIYLKLIESKTEGAKTIPFSPPIGGTETILIAEDDAEVRRLTRSILEDFGYTVIEAVDGEDAVCQFLNNRDKIQLLIFDVIMPKKNGKEAFEDILKTNSNVPVLFLSGYTADIIQQKGMLEEGINFISKPITPQHLLVKVREVLSQKNKAN